VLSVKHFLAQKSISEMEHPSYSPDLAPNDFWLFQKKCLPYRNKDFTILNTSKKYVTMELKAIPHWEFQKCFQQWQHHWAKCTAAEGQ
jgi:hypothetical protein